MRFVNVPDNAEQFPAQECPSCGLDVDAGHETCPWCQYEFPPQKKSMRWMALLFACLLILPLMWVLDRIF